MSIIDPVKRTLIKIFGSRNERLVKTYMRRVQAINDLEPRTRKMTDRQLFDRVAELREQVPARKASADWQVEALAIMREALDRNIGIRSIFNPELADQFPFDKLPADVMKKVEDVRARIANTPDAEVLGSEVPIEGWRQVDIPVEIYDAVREIYPESRPPYRCRPFDVQLVGGLVLSEGRIAEMKTGEGKTIVAPQACFLAALEGLQCHVVTVSDYHVQRDRDWVFPAFYKLGITVGAIHPYHMQPPAVKQKMYRCDVVYGTNSEFGFDYLRDNMKLTTAEQVQRKRDFCIVDEVDSILIDEARTPLIISGPAHDDAPQYIQANNVAEQLVALQRKSNQETAQRIKEDGFVEKRAKLTRQQPAAIQKTIAKFRDLGPNYIDDKEADYLGHRQYYVTKPEQKQASMTADGVDEAQKIVGTRFYVVGNDMAWDHLINQAVRAHVVYEKDRDYVVQNGEVVIVDEFTGRLMVGRQWSDGLHQAIEAKEAKHGVKIKKETQTLATITIQNFFKLYKRLGGMTGTAATEATEFLDIYKLDVVQIPTNRPVVRQDDNDLIYLTEKAKWDAIVENIREVAEAGRPVLVGTTSVDKSEFLSERLTKKHGLDHSVLNAKQHEREAHIVANAGQQHVDKRGRTIGNITLSTNMAGRGTDIRLGKGVTDLGGLHIIGTERHESRRIDNQLRGRAGRQGDPGSSRFFISMEDDLMKMFAGGKTMKALSMLGMQEEDAIEHKWITRSVERAQRKVEERNFQIRKNLLEYDEVMEYQRNYFYGTRQQVLEGEGVRELIFSFIAATVEDAVGRYLDKDYVPNQVSAAVRSIIGTNIEPSRLRADSLDEVEPRIRSDAKAEMRQEIETSLGEYMSDDIPPEDWDAKGLSSWAMSRFGVDLKQTQIRSSNPQELADRLTDAAHEQIDKKPLTGLSQFYEKNYAEKELAAWAKDKFDLDLEVDDLQSQRTESAEARQQRVAEMIYEQAVQRYDRREITYPVQFVMDMAVGAAQQGAEGTAWAVDQLVRWANQRYALDWTVEDVKAKTADQIYEELVAASEQWRGEKLTEWVDRTIDQHRDDQLAETFKQRWGVALDAEALAEADDVKAFVRDQAEAVLRTEVTQLERYVLLQILDQTWKDHLYAMDQLKDSIGLRGYGERDPKIEYKREGARMFQEMQESVRDKVSDLIFRAKLTANVQMRNAYAQQQASHEVDQNMGVAGVQGGGGAATAEQQADLEAANRAGSQRQVTETIVNKTEKVGRNDPCPCGSGKKYKQCCGR